MSKSIIQKTPSADSWLYPFDWVVMESDISNSVTSLRKQGRVMALVEEICVLYRDVNTALEHLCSLTCQNCADVCCCKATVWYDRRDLLFIALSTGKLPPHQIYRHDSGACCHLGSHGCRLSRGQRPFICTWYLCAAQTRTGNEQNSLAVTQLKEQLFRIKGRRKELEQFVEEQFSGPCF